MVRQRATASGADPLLIVNLDRDCTFDDDRLRPLTLRRREHEVHVTSGGLDTALHAIWTARRDASVLITGLHTCDLRALAPQVPPARRLLGFRREVGYWLLVGPSVQSAAAAAAFREVDASGHGAGHRVKALDAAPAGARGGLSPAPRAAGCRGSISGRRGNTATSASSWRSARSRSGTGKRCSASLGPCCSRSPGS